ncbi:MAG TPA: glycosyltransferase [Usitatibacter sp.]|nr:glycosyltransferase [Usitatibacter sp.]
MREAPPQPVTVVINNRDLLSWPRAMVGAIEKFEGLGEIVIVDNGSTYEPLLDWYASIPHTVVRLPNIGHTAPWSDEARTHIKTRFYVVSDPDMGLEETPRDCLRHLQACLARYQRAYKIGLGLRIDDVPPQSPFYAHVNRLERGYWQLPLFDGGVRPAPVDTTFALYDKKLLHRYVVGGGRTDHPYTARHLPWSVVEPDAEFRYYLEHADPTFSGYKKLTGAAAPRSP